MKDLCMQTLPVVESDVITPVSQVVVWGKFGQCLNNLKTNFRASSMTIIICPLTPLISGVRAIPLSTSLLFLLASVRESVEMPPGRVLLQPSQVMSLSDKLPLCSSPARVGDEE